MAGKSERRRSRPLQDVVVKPLQFFLLLLAVFLAPQFLRAQMPNRQPGGPTFPAAPSGPPNMPDSSRCASPAAMPERAQRHIRYRFRAGFCRFVCRARPGRSVSRPGNDSAPQVSTSAKADRFAAQAQHILKIMSDNLLKDFAKAGYTTKLLARQRSTPRRWLSDCGRVYSSGHRQSLAPRRAWRWAGRRNLAAVRIGPRSRAFYAAALRSGSGGCKQREARRRHRAKSQRRLRRNSPWKPTSQTNPSNRPRSASAPSW